MTGTEHGTPFSVRVRDFGWRHPGRTQWALRHVDLEIPAGQRVLIAGASGSGKSTLLRALAGLSDPQDAADCEGSITYRAAGQPLTGQQVRNGTGLMLQDPDSNLLMTRVGDDVALGLENACVPRSQIWPLVRQALDAVDFPYGVDRPTAALSGGEKQRVGLASLLARRPSFLVLDEPTANLDPDGVVITTTALREVLDDTQATMVIVEHRVSHVLDLVDRIVLLSPAGIVADGDPSQVLVSQQQALADSGIFVPGWRRPSVAQPSSVANPVGVPVLAARDVSVARGPHRDPVLHDVSLSIPAGTATAIIGPNGAGKSTLAWVLGGLLKPDSGCAFAENESKPLHRMRSKELARRVGSVFQEPEHQFVTNRVFTELAIGLRAAGLPKSTAVQRADSLLEQLGLAHLRNSNPFTLSGGEKRRLAVAAALAAQPPVLILDEPTFGQDARSWTTLVEMLANQLVRGTALVAITHDHDLVSALSCEVVVLDHGKITTEAAV